MLGGGSYHLAGDLSIAPRFLPGASTTRDFSDSGVEGRQGCPIARAVSRIDGIGSDVEQRTERERAVPEPGVRYRKLGRLECTVPKPQDIQIDGPGPPALPPDTSEAPLDGKKGRKQRYRLERRRQTEGAVQESRLGWSERRGFVKRRAALEAPEPSHFVGGKTDRAPAIAEVRPESDHDLEHNPPLPALARVRAPGQGTGVLDLTLGELGLVAFIVVAILSAKFWPRAGEWVALRLGRARDAER